MKLHFVSKIHFSMRNLHQATLKLAVLFTILSLTITACRNDNSDKEITSEATTPTAVETEAIETPKEEETVYAWVSKVNVRPTASNKIKSITSVKNGIPMKCTGKRSEHTSTFVFRGVAYQEPWLEVVTEDDKTGWVFGGAVKREGEDKGNPPLDDTRITFEHFGNYPLMDWVKVGTEKGEEEIDLVTTTYRKGNHILEITNWERGEFGYGSTYKLLDREKNLLRVRNFAFDVSEDFRRLRETVKDYIANPPVQYSRVQPLSEHYYALNAKPQRVNSTWSKVVLNDARANFQAFDATVCTKLKGDCVCSFSFGAHYNGPSILVSDSRRRACIKIGDELLELTGGEEEYRDELFAQSQMDYWIELKENGDRLLFGRSLDISREEQVERLVNTLLAMNRLPEEIPILNNSTGMAIREVQDIADVALLTAERRSRDGDAVLPTRLRYSNDLYEVSIVLKETSETRGEKRQEGILKFGLTDGETLASQAVRGICGC